MMINVDLVVQRARFRAVSVKELLVYKTPSTAILICSRGTLPVAKCSEINILLMGGCCFQGCSMINSAVQYTEVVS